MQDNFRSGLKKCGLDLTKEPTKIRAPRLLELLKKIRDTQGVDALRKVGVFNWDQSQEDWRNLRESYKNNIDLFHMYYTIVKIIYSIRLQEKKNELLNHNLP